MSTRTRWLHSPCSFDQVLQTPNYTLRNYYLVTLRSGFSFNLIIHFPFHLFRPEDDFEMDPSRIYQELSFTWNVNSLQRDQAAQSAVNFATSPPFEYRKKNLFRARIETLNQYPHGRKVTLLVYQLRKINCRVRQVTCSIIKGDRSSGLGIMSERTQGDEKLRQVFSIKTTEMSANLIPHFSYQVIGNGSQL